jgi:hypothetical protein
MSARIHGIVIGVMLAAGATRCVGAQSPQPARDTVDVTAGSRYVDFSKHTQSTSRAAQFRVADGQATPMPVVLWKFAFTDTGGRALLHVRSEPEQPSSGPMGVPPLYVILDRKTLALRGMHMGAAPGPHADLDVVGNTVTGVMAMPGRTDTLNLALPNPPFYGPLIDLVFESLPHKAGVVYRIPMWRPGAPGNEVRLYETVRREDIEVLGTTHRQATVMEERSADGTKLLSTAWLIDRAPFLVRWNINRPDGTSLRMDQEEAKK